MQVMRPNACAAALPDDTAGRVERSPFTAHNILCLCSACLAILAAVSGAAGGLAPFRCGIWRGGRLPPPDIAIGERLFGYFPMATHLVIEAADVSKRGLRDAAAHRQGVAPVYNAYARVSGDPAFAGKQGDYQALLRPLFMLSFLVDDYLAENEFFGARSVLLAEPHQDRFGRRISVHTCARVSR